MNCNEFKIVSQDDAKVFYWNLIKNCYKAFEKAGGCECNGFNFSNPDCTITTNQELKDMFTEECRFWKFKIFEYCDERNGKPNVFDQYRAGNIYDYMNIYRYSKISYFEKKIISIFYFGSKPIL